MDMHPALHLRRRTPVSRLPLLALLLLLGAPAAARAADPAAPHVRAQNPGLARLIAAAAERSSTLEDLLAQLERSDVIVYVEHGVLDANLRGRLRFAGTSGGWRYLRVQIDCRQNLTAQIAIIGHELKHAVEIAGARSTVDDASMARLYRDIGFSMDSFGSHFESDGAINAGEQVQREWLVAMAHVRHAANY
jgi:hypothetical protein